ncbi:MAG: GHKL domain-containing protein [Ruminococcaceae bacterium]|nr:GHKL domain-containing protein [Oscillospiraceae bacterium]
MAKIICDIFMYIFEALLLYNYANDLFPGKKKTIFKIISVILVNIILFFTYQTGNSVFNISSLLIMYFFTLWYVFGAHLRKALFHSTLFISIMLLSEIVILNLCSVIFDDFNAMNKDINAYIFVIVTSKIIYFSSMLIIKKLCVTQNDRKQKDSFYWMLFLFPLISIPVCILIFFVADNVEMSDALRICISGIFIFLLFADLVIFLVYENAVKNRMELYELKTAKFQQEIDEKYFEAIEQSQTAIRQFSHDTKNHLQQIRYLDNVEEIHKYLDVIINDVEKISYVRISSNKMLNLIISKYSAICEKKNIRFTPEVKLASLHYVDDVDLSTLLNNLLDNAVEAADMTENGFIELKIFSKNSNFDGIIIKNSCNTPPKHINKELITSKKDKLLHGLGMSIVKKELKKYDAIYDWNYCEETKIFETSIAIPRP